MTEATTNGDPVMVADKVQLMVELDPANPSHRRLLEALSQAGYYDSSGGHQTGCDELIRALLGQFLSVLPWCSTGVAAMPGRRAGRLVNSGDKMTPTFHPPAWGGPR